MTSSKPSFVFVPGAQHRSTCFEPVLDRLKAQGYEIATAELASVGAAEPGPETWTGDISNIKEVVSGLASAGKKIVLVMHSYGSLPSGEAVKGLLASQRAAQGQLGGVVNMVYMTSFVVPPGTRLLDVMGGESGLKGGFTISASGLEAQAKHPEQAFYNDLPPAEQQRHVAALRPASYDSMLQPTTWAPYREVDSTYIFCTKDAGLTYDIQKGMVAASGVKFREFTIESGHSPFLSKPDDVVAALVEVADSV